MLDAADLKNLSDAAALAVAIAVVVTGLTEVVKRVIGVAHERWMPLVPLALGVVVAALAASGYSWRVIVLGGLLCGLGSMGLYSGAKTVAGK